MNAFEMKSLVLNVSEIKVPREFLSYERIFCSTYRINYMVNVENIMPTQEDCFE